MTSEVWGVENLVGAITTKAAIFGEEHLLAAAIVMAGHDRAATDVPGGSAHTGLAIPASWCTMTA